MSKLLQHYQKVSAEELRALESSKQAQQQPNRKTRYSVARVWAWCAPRGLRDCA